MKVENTFLCSDTEITSNIFLPKIDESIFFLSNGRNVQRFHNVCTHKGCKLVEKSADSALLKCRMHGWSFNLDGDFLSGRGFEKSDSLNLKISENTKFLNANFKFPVEINDLPDRFLSLFDFSNYVKDLSITEILGYNADLYMEIFFDLYHVKAIHPGLRNYAKSFDWFFGENWIIQQATKQDSVIGDYKKFNDLLMEKQTDLAAVWFGIYPNIMIELYQKAIVVSQIFHIDERSSKNVRTFYFHKEIADNQEIKDAFISAWEATDKEDDEFGEQLQVGRDWCENIDISFVNHPTEEQGLEHYKIWCKNNNFAFGQTELEK